MEIKLTSTKNLLLSTTRKQLRKKCGDFTEVKGRRGEISGLYLEIESFWINQIEEKMPVSFWLVKNQVNEKNLWRKGKRLLN